MLGQVLAQTLMSSEGMQFSGSDRNSHALRGMSVTRLGSAHVSVWVLPRHPTTARRLGMAPDQPQASSSIVARSWGTSRCR